MTTVSAVDRWHPSPYAISKAARIIQSGGLVAFPTETVYGLGADALNAEAVKKIYIAKGRPSDNPLIVHVNSILLFKAIVQVNDTALALAKKFWPGPLTLVLPADDIIPSVTRGGLRTAAIRMPDNPVALELIACAGTPIAAPSANLSGRPSPTDADTVLHDMNGRIDMILDGGSTELGIESTVIDVSDPSRILLLRPGGLATELIEKVTGIKLEIPDELSKKKSPGTHYRHYAPKVPVKIWRKGEPFPSGSGEVAFMGIDDPKGSVLSEPIKYVRKIIFTSTANYAHGLFAGFRKFENENISSIVVQWPDDITGLGAGLRDRILRAAGIER
ncbi:MAG: threonylcarbamoyl-AMP synthase [Synergistaceae bacterium]|nr:threonylcarbamoyl-AMP synthase [Synergistaceae bacterium]